MTGVEEHRIIEITTTAGTLLLQEFLANLFKTEPPGGPVPVLEGNKECCGEVGGESLSRGVSGLDNAAGVGVGGE